jgi:hypothetical protein
MVISLLGLAPAYSLPLTPDQVEVRAEQELELKYSREAATLELMFNEQAVHDNKRGFTSHYFIVPSDFCEESVTLFMINLQKSNWDVYKTVDTSKRTVLKICRKNTIP